MTKKVFEKSSYLSQVRMLRGLARAAVEKFPIKVKEILFINHGENATYRVRASDGKQYLLRIHRGGYHTDAAISEELQWLARLSKDKSLLVPKPLRARSGQYLAHATDGNFPKARQCCMFHWIDGAIIDKSLTVDHAYQLGRLIARVQQHQPRSRVRQRDYWRAEGLAGKSPKWGALDKILDVNERDRKELQQTQKKVYQELLRYQRKFPKRMGMIHADMHFGNLLVRGGQLSPIDFDDCGTGFYIYDLAVGMVSLMDRLPMGRKEELIHFKEAMVLGYSELAHWDEYDERMLPVLMMARNLAAVGWLNSRSDNPRLAKWVPKIAARTLAQIENGYGFLDQFPW